MSLISHIAQIDPTLDQKDFWNLERLQIMDVLYQQSGGKQQLDRAALGRAAPEIAQRLNQLIEDGSSQKRLSEVQKSATNSVLGFLQDQGWRVLFYPVRTKKPRRSVIPVNSYELISWRMVEQWRSWFWQNSATPLNKNDVTLALILEVAYSLGVNHRLLKKHVFPSLSEDCIQDGQIRIPLGEDSNGAVLTLPLNGRARLLWAWYQRNVQQPHDSWQKSITRTREFLKRILSESPLPLPPLANTPKLDSLLRAGSFSLAESGIEPFIVNVLQSDLLPLPPPSEHCCFGFAPVDNWPLLVKRSRPNLTSQDPVLTGDQVTANSNGISKNSTPLNRDSVIFDADILEKIGWLPACQCIAQRLMRALRQACIDNTGHFRNRVLDEATVRQILAPLKADAISWLRWYLDTHVGAPGEASEFNRHIELLEKGFTAIDLMMEWAFQRLAKDRVTATTLATDVRLVFVRGFFWTMSSARLDDWDDEDAEVLISDHLLVANTNSGSQRKAINLLKRIGEWARTIFGCFEGVFFPSALGTGVRLTWRNHVIGLEEHELLLRTLDPSTTDHCNQVRAVLDLVFYGGLRSGEVANLCLGDIVSGSEELVLHLRAFKTPSARRAIQFHLLAPPDAVERVREVLNLRQIAYRRYANKLRGKTRFSQRNTLLFSMDQRISRSSAIRLVTYARDVLKAHLGDGADLHLCRHSFASHLLLRWYCSRHPDLIAQLREKNHFAFTQDGISKIRRYVGEPASMERAAQQPSSLIHLIKIMGHKTTQTLFQVYVHSFEVIANHALRRAQTIDDELALTGYLITELVPGMRSRTSQRALKSRRVGELLKKI